MTTMTDPKDILRQVQADLNGVSADKVIFTDARNKKRKIKKVNEIVKNESQNEIVDNNEGFGITGSSVEFIRYDQIGKGSKKRVRSIKNKKLEEWGAFDFFYYAEKKFIDKYDKGMGLSIGGNSVEINRIKDKITDMFGFCCNLVMKDYIDFFFKNYIDSFVKQDGGFFFRQMRNDKIICEFQELYNFSLSFLKYTESHKKIDDGEISKLAIEDSYQIGDTSLVSNYGIVISLNWLMKVKKKAPKDAALMILAACKALDAKGMIDIVKRATERFSPYPTSIPFKSPQLIMDKINKDIKIDIEFNDNTKFDFLK